MKQVVINNLLSIIIDNKECSEKDIKVYKYGLEGLYNLITKTVVVLIITLLLNTAKEFGLILLFYALLRSFGFGIHAESSLMCWISTLTIYVLGSLLVKEIILTNEIALTIWIFAFISFLLWAPADTPKRPLIRERQRKIQKLKVCIISLLYLLLIFFINSSTVINAISYSLLIEMICVNPITYKLTKTRFNNYKYYKKGLNDNKYIKD